MFQNLQPYYQMITAGLALFAILIVGLIVYRMLSKRVRGRRGSRLGITEYHELDKTRRLVLVRRDGIEHLILIGGQHDLVIENNIGLMELQPQHMPVNEPIPIRVPPRPAVFGNHRPPLRPVPPVFSHDEENNDRVS